MFFLFSIFIEHHVSDFLTFFFGVSVLLLVRETGA
jgi:hypothetical protein